MKFAHILCVLGSPNLILTSLLQTASRNWQLFTNLNIINTCPENLTGVSTIDLQADNPNNPGLTRFKTDGIIEVEIDSDRLEFAGNIYNVILHEIGHVLGLKHPDPPNESIMSYTLRVNAHTGKILPDDYRSIIPYHWPTIYSNSSLKTDDGLIFG